MSDIIVVRRELTEYIEMQLSKLYDISCGLKIVRNRELAEDISRIARCINDSLDAINKLVDDDLDKQFKAAEQASLNVLNATLSGIAVVQEQGKA